MNITNRILKKLEFGFIVLDLSIVPSISVGILTFVFCESEK